MTNNIAVTEGSGKTVATEDISSAQYQKIKVVDGTASGTTGLKINADGSLTASVYGTFTLGNTSVSGTVNLGPTSVAVLQGTNPWLVNMPSSSVISYQLAGSVLAVSVINMPSPSVIAYQLAGSVLAIGGTSSVVGVVSVSSIVGSLPGGVALIGGITSIIGAVTPYAQPVSYTFGVSSMMSKSTADSVLSAPGASLRNFVTQITVTNGSATASHVLIKDSGAGTMFAGYAAASGGGFSASFPVPIRQATQNASVDIISSAQASITTAISGYVAA